MKIIRSYLLIAGMVSLPFSIWAQVAAPSLPQLDQSRRPGDQRIELPSLEPDEPEPKFILPPVTIPDDYEALSARVQVFVKEFHFNGNSTFTDEQLKEVAQGYTGRTISSHK